MEGRKIWCEVILFRELKIFFKWFEVKFLDDFFRELFVGEFFRGDFLCDIVQDVRFFVIGVDIVRKIDRNVDVKFGIMYVFEIDIGRMGDKCYKVNIL